MNSATRGIIDGLRSHGTAKLYLSELRENLRPSIMGFD